MGLTGYLACSSAWRGRLPAPLPGSTVQPPRVLRGKRTWRRGSRARCAGIASGRFARAAVGAQRGANEDARALHAPHIGRTQAQRTHQPRACASDVAWIWLLHLNLAAPSTIPQHATRAPALHIILLFVLRTKVMYRYVTQSVVNSP